MIEFLFKLIYFHRSDDRGPQVSDILLYITTYLSTIFMLSIYILYSKMGWTSDEHKYSFWSLFVVVFSFLYYWINVRQKRILCTRGVDRHYDFGKYNGAVKPLLAVLIFFAMVLLFSAVFVCLDVQRI
jgi:hypothetical protein